jgi:hypothetical protein
MLVSLRDIYIIIIAVGHLNFALCSLHFELFIYSLDFLNPRHFVLQT